MSAETKLIPSGSQTVGPFFSIGLGYLTDRTPATVASAIAIRGRVLDRDRAPVPDALLEFWYADSDARSSSSLSPESGCPRSFRRVATDGGGQFSLTMTRPAAAASGDGRMQAPHMLVLVFARGLLRHLISRVYFEDEPGNESDPVLLGIPAERRGTLIARIDTENSFRWDVILQGTEETVFFAW